jgi:hypothetical protein
LTPDFRSQTYIFESLMTIFCVKSSIIGPNFFLHQFKIKIIYNFVIFVVTKKGKTVAEAYTTQPNSKASSRVLYNIFESTCGG